MNQIDTDYNYCTARLDGGKKCPLRHKCKRYSHLASKADIPLWWTDGFYDYKTGRCDLIDKKTKTND